MCVVIPGNSWEQLHQGEVCVVIPGNCRNGLSRGEVCVVIPRHRSPPSAPPPPSQNQSFSSFSCQVHARTQHSDQKSRPCLPWDAENPKWTYFSRGNVTKKHIFSSQNSMFKDIFRDLETVHEVEKLPPHVRFRFCNIFTTCTTFLGKRCWKSPGGGEDAPEKSAPN